MRVVSILLAAGCGAAGSTVSANVPQLEQRACPAELTVPATCHEGRDDNGSWILAVVPDAWNRSLVVHAHGGPRLGPPEAGDSDPDVVRFSGIIEGGFAWVGSTYRRGGYGVRMAAEDVDISRQFFWRQFGTPALTILHGQSYGGNVAAKASELYALSPEGDRRYDGVLLTNGVLFGGTSAYNFRADLRAVYQFYCRNLPRPEEPQYPLWQGLAPGSPWTRNEVRRRLDECTGAGRPENDRTHAQSATLGTITAVTGIAAENLESHLEWGTFTFADLALRLQGNPFDNTTTVYRGSPDDEALNLGVARFSADQRALDRLAYDADLTGLIVIPTVTVHYQDDPIVSAAADAAYGARVDAAGKQHLLVQVLAENGTHSRLAAPDYLGPLISLTSWAGSGARPMPQDLINRCREVSSQSGGTCSLMEPGVTAAAD
jgi:hypothetical protein